MEEGPYHFMRKYPIWEWVSLFFVAIGLLLGFFYYSVGSVFVGLGTGMGFWKETNSLFAKVKDLFTTGGVIKTLIGIGFVVFLILAIPAFVIAFGVGFAILLLVNKLIV